MANFARALLFTALLAPAGASAQSDGGLDAIRELVFQARFSADLAAVRESFATARRAMRLIRENLAWATLYNAVALPLAAAGYIGPWEAALGMGASSAVVLLNALRPLAVQRPWKASTSSFRSPSPSYS